MNEQLSANELLAIIGKRRPPISPCELETQPIEPDSTVIGIQCVHRFTGHQGSVLAAAFFDQEQAVSIGADNTIRYWHRRLGYEIPWQRIELKGQVSSTDISFELKLACCCYEDGRIELWDLATTGRVVVEEAHDHPIHVTSICSRTGLLGTANHGDTNGEIAIWGLEDLHGIAQGRGTAWHVAFTPDGRYAIFRYSKLRVLDLETLKTYKVLEGINLGEGWMLPAGRFMTTPDSREILVGYYDGTVLHIEIDTDEVLNHFSHCRQGKGIAPCNIAISPDGDLVVSSYKRECRVWSLSNWKHRFSFAGHRGNVTDLEISPSGRFLLTGSADGTMRLWEFERARRTYWQCPGTEHSRATSPGKSHTIDSAEVLHQHEVGLCWALFLQQEPLAVVRD